MFNPFSPSLLVLLSLLATYFISLDASLCTTCKSCAACKWGSDPIPDTMRPDCTFTSNFPSTPTVSVGKGDSFEQAQTQCTELVGKKGWCTINLTGIPSEKPLTVTRSYTKVTASAGVILRGSGKGDFINFSSNIHHVSVDGLKIVGHTTTYINGIMVYGTNIRYIALYNNQISDFNANMGAHAIAVYGTKRKGVRHLCIADNTVSDMQLGFSEAIAVNGFVTYFAIQRNEITNVNNIAIDAIGGEGTYPPQRVDGRKLPAENDAAKYGFIEHNSVDGMSTKTNPQYGNQHSWAASIYVDGANYIYVAHNDVKASPWAFEIGAENCVKTRHIIVENNTARGGYYGDMVVGGYRGKGFEEYPDIQCNPLKSKDKNEGHGYVSHITVRENTFLTTDGKEDTFVLQKRTTYAFIDQDGVYSQRYKSCGLANGNQNSVCTK